MHVDDFMAFRNIPGMPKVGASYNGIGRAWVTAVAIAKGGSVEAN